MNEANDILDLIKKAKESLEAAKALFEDGFYGFSASRAYYSMFYTAEAVLLTKKLSYSKHSAIIAAFGKEFIKTEILPQKLRDYLVSAFDLRQLGDYGSSGAVDKEKPQILIEQAKEFINTIEEFLRNKGYNL
ncbi:MAG: HEPN domain-containing protein [bacterium]